MTFKRFKKELHELKRKNLLPKLPRTTVFKRLMWAYYATEAGGVMRDIEKDADILEEAFERKLPDLLLQAGDFLLTETLLPMQWAQMTEMYYE